MEGIVIYEMVINRAINLVYWLFIGIGQDSGLTAALN